MDTYGIYTAEGFGICTVEALSEEDALKVYAAQEGLKRAPEGYWAESVQA